MPSIRLKALMTITYQPRVMAQSRTGGTSNQTALPKVMPDE